LFRAAAAAFAARGFDGAGVDEIAAAARVNKAMLYYHFGSKRGLYTEVLRDMFGAVAADVEPLVTRREPPSRKLEIFIDTIAAACAARPHFPSIWLRELADEGRHLDAELLPVVRRVVETLTRILAQGQRAGRFRRVHPVLVQFGIIGPLLVFLASASARARVLEGTPARGALDISSAIAHIKAATLATVMLDPRGGSR
jgi:TetR/AcrR family transcriptional regulator